MLANTNKTNKKLFAVATSLLALSFLLACGFDELTSRNNQVAIEKSKPQSRINNNTYIKLTQNYSHLYISIHVHSFSIYFLLLPRESAPSCPQNETV